MMLTFSFAMDSMTHVVLGACLGELIAGKQVKKKALLFGALAQSVPDVDFVASFFLHGAENTAAHRGITHSLLFGLLATMVLSVVVYKSDRQSLLSFRRLLLLFGVNILTHLFLDTCNAYGVSLLMPFTDYRFSFHLLYVADPLFSVAPFVSFLLLLLRHRSHRRRVLWARTGLALSSLYLCWAFGAKQHVTQAIQKQWSADQKAPEFFTTPAPFNTLLWFAAVKQKDGFASTYRSVFDEGPSAFSYSPRNDAIAETVTNKKDLQLLKLFAQGYYTLEQRGDTTLINVLRFGKVAGWYNAEAPYAFYYYLNRPGDNDLVVQRGRFQGWNRQATAAFFKRMLGKPAH